MILYKTIVEKIYKVMEMIVKKYSFLSYLEFEDDILKIVVEYNYCRKDEIDDVKDMIYFCFSKNVVSYCHEWTGEDEADICKLIVNLKF